MSEESKTPDADYVHMGDVGVVPGRNAVKITDGLDDPNLSQEDLDMRLAIALQQQENAAVYEAHKKKHEANKAAQVNRTARSGTQTRLAAVRAKDHGALSVPAEYTTENAYVSSKGDYLPPAGNHASLDGALPQEIADFNLALELQRVEQAGAGTAQTLTKIMSEDAEDEEAQRRRTERSNYHLPAKK